MKNKKILMSSLAAFAMVAVVGSGFAVWNFDNNEDSAKGIYNLGIYVTPEISTVGTVSTNNDYALVLDQGALTNFENSSSAKIDSLADNEDYYKRGIYVGKLKKNANFKPDQSVTSENKEFETYPNGSYVYEQVPSISGYWIQEMTDAQSIVAENVNDMSFSTSIKLREDLAQYVQVRNDDEKYVLNGEDFVKETFETSGGENTFNYVEYNYDWGDLSEVLKLSGSNYRITKTFKEIKDVLDQKGDTGEKDFEKAVTAYYQEKKSLDLENDNEEDYPTDIDEWYTDTERAPRIDDLQNIFREKLKGKELNITEDDCYNTTENGLTLRAHKAIKAYASYDINTGEFKGYFDKNTIDGGGRVATYFMSYDEYILSGDPLGTAGITDQSAFANLLAGDAADKSYVEVKTPTGGEGDSPINEEGTTFTVRGLVFEIVNCYYFRYYLTTTNYGSQGDKASADKKLYENARFVYYPVTSEAFKTSYGESYKNDFEEPLNLEVNQNDKKVINTLTDKINYVKKPSTDKEYEYMLSTFMKSLGVGGADASNQVVDLNNRYVIVEFGSTMSTRGSNGVMGDQGLPGPEMG